MRVVAAVMVAVVAAGAWFFTSRDRVHSTLIPEANAGRKMLAVLPFENLGPTDQEYFADGITEEITTHLAGLSGLGVISRTSAVKYKGSGKSLRDIGKELGVEYALEGSVRWDKSSGQNNVRISVQLIHIDDDTHLWADNFDRVYEQIFTLQSEIAERVARELNVTLLEPERVAMAERPTENLEAYDLYMRGRAQFDRAMQINEMDEGLALVEQAVALDSTFAEAQGFLAPLRQPVLQRHSFGTTAAERSAQRGACGGAPLRTGTAPRTPRDGLLPLLRQPRLRERAQGVRDRGQDAAQQRRSAGSHCLRAAAPGTLGRSGGQSGTGHPVGPVQPGPHQQHDADADVHAALG
jgi:TolB-like protein